MITIGKRMTGICRVLIVEDDEGIRELLQTLFDDEGYPIAIAASAEEVHAAFSRDTFDLAIIEATLPRGEDGLELAARVRHAGCAVVLVTGDSRRFDEVERSGYPFLLKPFRIEELLRLVSELTSSRQCERPPA